jgi:hypothetical protein
MSTKTDVYDVYRQWASFLRSGTHLFSEELLPNTGLIISPDGSKISVIDDESGDSPYSYYDQQEQTVGVDIRFLRRGGRSSTSLVCPSCKRPHFISLDAHKQVTDTPIQYPTPGWARTEPNDGIDGGLIYIKDNEYFACECGVEFWFNDKYRFVSVPFDIKDLEPIFQLGMSRTADLLVHYILSSDGRSLLEDVGVVSGSANAPSLTDDPSRWFHWTIPPCFSPGHGVYDVKIWRRRIYVLGCIRFAEATWNHNAHWGTTEIKYFKFRGAPALSVFTPPDELLNNPKSLDSLIRGNKLFPRGRGGRNNVKVADLPESVKKALGRKYVELKEVLTNVKQDAKAARKLLKDDWSNSILTNYPILKQHEDFLKEIDPLASPSNPDGSGGKAPWEIAIEIAARETIPKYNKEKPVSAGSLIKAAIIPPKE